MSKLSAFELNKLELIKVCKDKNIKKIEVCYDGCADSGQINESMVYFSETLTDYDCCANIDVTCNYYQTEYVWANGRSVSDIVFKQGNLQDLVEEMTYSILETRWGGWENNEGSYGEIVFNPDGSAAFTHTFRIEETHEGVIENE